MPKYYCWDCNVAFDSGDTLASHCPANEDGLGVSLIPPSEPSFPESASSLGDVLRVLRVITRRFGYSGSRFILGDDGRCRVLVTQSATGAETVFDSFEDTESFNRQFSRSHSTLPTSMEGK